jgi:hypothetical protein
MTWISTYCCTRIARIYASQQRNLTEIIMDVTQTIALTLGTAWASGINLYAAMLMLGYLGTTGSLDLPPDLQILTNPIVMLSAGIMYCIEFFADKVPGVDTGWDGLSTFIRIPAGAVLAAGAVGDAGTATHVVAALAGGTLAAGSHATKAGTRVLINTSPEPVSNWFASLGEDVAVIAGLWTALHYPVVFIILLILFILLMIWLLPKLWRGIRRVLRFIGKSLASDKTDSTSGAPPGE